LKVYIVPIQENIMPPLVYVVRRGVKEAMEAKADLLILDMKTDGGRVDVTEEIIQIISNFPGLTVTYVNDRAFSAGAFIAVATQKIYMAPQSVIGAAAPIMMAPGGVGTGNLPDTMEVKMTSAIRALVRVKGTSSPSPTGRRPKNMAILPGHCSHWARWIVSMRYWTGSATPAHNASKSSRLAPRQWAPGLTPSDRCC
jgi:membrane-bound ClpP family serine protease